MYMPMDCKIVWLLVWITIIGIRDNAKATFLDISTRFVHLAANCAKIVLLSAWIHGVSNLSVMSLTKGRPRLYIKGLKAEPTEIRKRQEPYTYIPNKVMTVKNLTFCYPFIQIFVKSNQTANLCNVLYNAVCVS